MQRRALLLGLLCLGMLAATPAFAAPAVTSLGELFSIAHDSEPGYRAAKASLDASRARTREAFGAMLPQISATATSNGNRRRYDEMDAVTRTCCNRS